MRKRWPWQPVQAATAAATEAISSLGPALLARLDCLQFLVVGSDAAKREIYLEIKLCECLLGKRSVVKHHRGTGGFTGLSYCERTAYWPSRFSGVGRRGKELANRMSLPKAMSPVETVARINLSSLTVEEETPTLTPVQLRPVLPSRVAIVGNYLPRQCGIATFTTDLCGALSAEYGAIDLLALPVNDTEAGYSYPTRVRFELSEDNLASYRRAADFLNFGNVDIVCLQHEYGIFGGRAGSHILELLRHLRMPFVTTLHTVLREPDADQRIVMEEIATLSDRLIVMSEHSAEILQEVFRVPDNKIDLIPHGVPDLPFIDPNFYKDCFGTEGKVVLLTFGLLSPNKGIENVIQALPRILSRHSNVVYMVAGATHPHLKRREGEQYRLYLQKLAIDLGVQANVIFHNRFVSPQEMVELVSAADIYITPYKHKAQVVSGTLAYALSAGKAVISTPYLHAIELLDDERGVLVPFDDPDAVATKTIELLDNESTRHVFSSRQ